MRREATAGRVGSPLHQPLQHESGLRHASGEARYVDDLPLPPGTVHAWLVTSPHAHARIRSVRVDAAKNAPGVRVVLTAADVPGHNLIGPAVHDEELLASEEVLFIGQTVVAVFADTLVEARKAAALVEVDYDVLPAVFTIAEAIEKGAFLTEPHVIARGDVDAALKAAPVRLKGIVETGGQDHFYLETHAALAVSEENGAVRIQSSTQHPAEVQSMVATILGVGRHFVTVEVPRMGGGFGGKETQSAGFAALAALAATRTGRAAKVWLNRDADMIQTGKRHPFWSEYDVGFSNDGKLLAVHVRTFSNGGYSLDLSHAILDRALFHLDNAYFIPVLRFEGRVAKTNLPSNTAFRGFGGPQGMVVMEEILNHAAQKLGMDATLLRRLNFYGDAPSNIAPYGEAIRENRLPRIYDELMASSDYDRRRDSVSAFNAKGGHLRRGLAFQPVKFGISFTTSFLNQAGAFVLIYADGTVQLNHGGTEMGQGLHTKMLTICADALGVPLASIRAMNTSTDKVPNTSATAASSGADLNGQAVKEACDVLRSRLEPVARMRLGLPEDAALRFEDGRVFAAGSEKSVPFAEVTHHAHLSQISMSATGYYRTPGIHYDRVAGRGKPFHYYAYGGAVVEVEVDGRTGEHRLVRVDILHDCGDSLSPAVDIGQVEGGFVQGHGWLTCEEVIFDSKGVLKTHSPDTYKIPALGDVPREFHVRLLEDAAQSNVIHGSKAVGEPPLMLAIGTVSALRQAVASFGPAGVHVPLSIPCTPEAVLLAIDAVSTP